MADTTDDWFETNTPATAASTVGGFTPAAGFVNTSPLAATGENDPALAAVSPSNPVSTAVNPMTGVPFTEAELQAMNPQPGTPNANALAALMATQAPPGPGVPALQANNLTSPGLLALLGNSPLLAPYTQPMPAAMTTPFAAPSLADVQGTPGYLFTLQQGIDALQKSAAAKGTLLTGGMLKSLEEFGSGLADSTYQQQYNNAYQTWAGNQTQASQNYATNYNVYRGNQVQPFDMLSALAGGGQAAISSLNTAGLGVGAQNSNTLTGIGNATAAGTVGGANAATSGLGTLGNAALLSSLMNGSSYNPGTPNSTPYGPADPNPYGM